MKTREINDDLMRIVYAKFDIRSDGVYWKDGTKFNWRKSADFPRAGTIGNRGYRYIPVNGKLYREHRIVFYANYGYVPEVIDHINRNTSDNRIENLRASSQAHNTLNTGMSRNNTSGVKGVSWSKKKNKWHAQLSTKGKRFHLGYFENKDEAKAAYDRAHSAAMAAAI